MTPGVMGIFIKVIDAIGIEQRGTPLYAMHFVSLGKQ
jgi:hypothetical protein